jgi:hypothetical protein
MLLILNASSKEEEVVRPSKRWVAGPNCSGPVNYRYRIIRLSYLTKKFSCRRIEPGDFAAAKVAHEQCTLTSATSFGTPDTNFI